MNIVLWVLQVLLGIFFIFNGIQHYIVPPNLPAMFQWMYDLPTWLNIFSGTAELLAGLGLILPGVTKIQTWLTPLAAVGLVIVMTGAVVFHIPRGEIPNVLMNIVLAGLAAFVAYGRWRLSPLTDRSGAQ